MNPYDNTRTNEYLVKKKTKKTTGRLSQEMGVDQRNEKSKKVYMQHKSNHFSDYETQQYTNTNTKTKIN